MAKREIVIFIILVNLAILLLVSGIILFIAMYRKRKVLHEKEKAELESAHQVDLLNAKMESQYQAMQFIGREIHDNVGQKLTLASLYTKQEESKTSELTKGRLLEIGTIIDESLTELRHLSKSLTNPDTLQASLDELLSEEAKRINAAGICFVSFLPDGSSTFLPPAEKNIFFRILQEFIQNSLKHAECRRIELAISLVGHEIHINASDDGKGFDIQHVSAGIGLQNMERRALQVNADLTLTSIQGKGTSLLIKWKP
jgi:signal transduction histidine kinase